jgi:hypothetical protein
MVAEFLGSMFLSLVASLTHAEQNGFVAVGLTVALLQYSYVTLSAVPFCASLLTRVG